jgi:hypothetical protein
MVWGMISRNEELRLVMIDETLNANIYIKILGDNLPEFDGEYDMNFYANSCFMLQSSLQSQVIV